MAPPGYTSTLRVQIGDDLAIPQIDVHGVPAGQGVQAAWLTVKRDTTDADADAVLQKIVTVDLVGGVGVIRDTGTTSGIAKIHFEGPPSDTLKLTAGVPYVFDVQIESTSGKRVTYKRGILIGEPQVTQA